MKRHKEKVSNKPIQKVVAAIKYYKRDKGMKDLTFDYFKYIFLNDKKYDKLF